MTAIIFDTETTDREPDRELIEAAWLKLAVERDLGGEAPDVISLLATESYNQRFRPSKPVGFGALAVHHILPSELERCPPASDFRLPPDVTYLVGHTIDFDWETIGKPPVKRIDTCAMSRELWPEADSHSQSALLYMLCGATDETRKMLRGAHSALTDVLNNRTLLSSILSVKPEIQTWSALWEFSEEARIPKVMFMGRNKGQPISSLDTGEIAWYLERDFIDAYQRKALTREMSKRGDGIDTDDFDEVESA